MKIRLATATAPARGHLVRCLPLFVFLVMAIPCGVRADDHHWIAEFGPQGTDGPVYAMSAYGDQFILAGRFTAAGNSHYANITRWDGLHWSDVGGGITGPPGSRVSALVLFQGALIAAGSFSEAGGIPTANLAQWNGTAWAPLGSGTNGPVSALCVHEGLLYAGGDFTAAGGSPAPRLAVWDGSSWSAPAEGPDAEIRGLLTFDGDLIVGGRFTQIGDLTANRVARWDGSVWQAIGSGFDDDVNALCVYDGDLVAAGIFDNSGENEVDRIAWWDGVQWQPYPCTWWLFVAGSEHINALISLDGYLVVGGEFTHSEEANGRGEWETRNMLRFDGSWWFSMNVGPDDEVHALATWDEDLYVGGDFRKAGFDMVASGIARWDDPGFVWHHLGRPTEMGGRVNALIHHEGRLVAGGDFRRAGEIIAEGIASWDGYEWSPMDAGMSGPVASLTTYDGDPIAGGTFYVEDAGGFSGLARWDGSVWRTIGGGISYPGYGAIANALHVWADRLVVAGGFSTAGEVPANNIAYWDGSQWHAMGVGFPHEIHALTIFEGDLIAAKGRVNGEVYRWQDGVWITLGEVFSGFTHGPDSYNQGVHSLAVYNGELIAGGKFLEVGETHIEGIARWDGSAWVPFPSTPGSAVEGLAIFQGDLIAVGDFPEGIKRWNGTTWHSFGTGMDVDAIVKAICPPENDQHLYLGGEFRHSGNKAACNVAHWSENPAEVPSTSAGAVHGGLVTVSPNPLDPNHSLAMLQLVLPRAGSVRITVHDLAGRQVATVLDRMMPSGEHAVSWSGRNREGIRLPSGVYVMRMQADGWGGSRKLLVVR